MGSGFEIGFDHKGQPWWSSENTTAYDAFKAIESLNQSRETDLKMFMRLYTNRNLAGYGPTDHFKKRGRSDVSLNVIKAVIDTVAARIAKAKPRPRFQTFGGNYSLQRRARLLEKWTDAQFYLSNFPREAQRAFVDGCVFGSGAVKIERDPHSRGGICAERTFPGELFVDRAEAVDGRPRQLFQRKYVDREVLVRTYPDKEREIRQANREVFVDGEEISGADSMADQLEVVEAWHLPSSPGAGDGRREVSIKGVTLISEEYKRDHFPFVFFHWSKELRGFWGMGVAEELVGIQVEINRLMTKIQKAMHLMSAPQWWVEQGSRVKQGQIVNEVGAINQYVGQPPVVYTPRTFDPEVFAHLERLYQRAFEIAGVSRLSSSGIKPPGLESGVALREHHDIESERFSLVGQDWEHMFMEAADHMIEIGKEISEEDPNYSVVVEGDKYTIQQVKWSDVDMDKDAYVLRVFPSSALPTTPAGRLSFVSDMLNLRLVEPKEGKELLGFPDIEEHLALDRATSENLDRIIEKIVDDGEYEAPEPFQDHQLALKKFQAAYNKAVQDNVPESHLRLLRMYMSQTNRMMELAKQQLMARQAQLQNTVPGAAPPTGQDGAPPTAVGPQDGTIPQ